MAKKHSPEQGSKIAKSGFKNEDNISKKINNWETDPEAKIWLKEMGINISKIKELDSKTSRELGLGNIKSDVIVTIDGEKHGISVKFYTANFNQLQRGTVENISKLLEMPLFVTLAMKKIVGSEGHQPQDYLQDVELKLLKEKRKNRFTQNQSETIERHKKLLIDDFPNNQRTKIRNWFDINKKTIIKILLRGKTAPSPQWFMAVKHNNGKISKTKIVSMENAINHFSKGEICFSNAGVFYIGKISMQRKSGDGGRISGQDLQFKIKPEEIFSI